MTSKVRTLASLLVALTLLVGLPMTCVCAPVASSQADGHECCAPPAGVRSDHDHVCCADDDIDSAPAATPVPVTLELASMPVVTDTFGSPAPSPLRAAAAIASPPRFAVLRI